VAFSLSISLNSYVVLVVQCFRIRPLLSFFWDGYPRRAFHLWWVQTLNSNLTASSYIHFCRRRERGEHSLAVIRGEIIGPLAPATSIWRVVCPPSCVGNLPPLPSSVLWTSTMIREASRTHGSQTRPTGTSGGGLGISRGRVGMTRVEEEVFRLMLMKRELNSVNWTQSHRAVLVRFEDKYCRGRVGMMGSGGIIF